MNAPPKWRLLIYIVAMLALAAGIGWPTYKAYATAREVSRLPIRFKAMQDEYLLIADHLPDTIHEMDRSLRRAIAHNDRVEFASFQRKGQDLKEWLGTQRTSAPKLKIILMEPASITMAVDQLLAETENALDDYLRSAQEIARTDSPVDTGTGQLQRLALVDEKSRQLLLLGSQARAHGEAIQLFLTTNPKDWLTRLQHVFVASLLALAALFVWLAIVVYRMIVAPLRMKLIESDTIIEKQKRLASFGEAAMRLAHEIRNPLTAINARLFILENALAGNTSQHEHTTLIRGEINRLDRILKDFLRLARPADPKLVPVAPRDVLREVQNLLSPQAEKQSIELRQDTVEDVHCLADELQLKQVLINLVQNAMESIGQNGTITLRARDGTARLKGEQCKVAVLEVEDTGAGISPSVQKKLFDPFFSTKNGGTGLGLPIAAQIIEKHGGELEFRTQVGKGTTFSIILPIYKKPDETAT